MSEAIELGGIQKYFGGVHANRGASLTVASGEIHALVGENGAGKSTLMRILAGLIQPDAGSVKVEGRDVTGWRTGDAIAAGVGMVHQHFMLVPTLTVAENVVLGREPHRGPVLDHARARAEVSDVAARYGLRVEAARRVGDLSVGEAQRVEILKTLFRGARILILDEPTAALTPSETEGLFDAVRAMSAEGMAVILISHKLHEVRAVTNRIMVMRQGRAVAELANDSTVTERRLAELMCGRELTPPAKPPASPGRVLLRLSAIATAGSERRRLKDVSLALHAGEIMGIARVAGNGQRELAEVIAGMATPLAGRIEIDGKPVDRLDPRGAQDLRIARIPEDRIGTGLLMQSPLADSMALPRIGRAPFSRHGLLDRGAIRSFAEAEIEKFAIRTPGPLVRTGTLSGGNLQKALLARELAWDPLVVIAAQPTRGLDVGATQFVQAKFLELRAAGCGLIVISEDLEELFQISDRIAVMSEGRILGDFPIAEASLETIGLLMTGGAHPGAAA